MIFFDTSVIVYSIIDQDAAKQALSDKLILEALKNNTLVISPLILSELIFVLSKLGLSSQNISKAIHPFRTLKTIFPITIEVTNQAFELCSKTSACRNINDAIHLIFAEKYCDKLITFDKGFKKFIPHTELQIKIF